ncbi:MAG: class I SAM-dependent methyltransferase [Candidatus Paceibacterota bacterium]|jgi:ubiquinone/menaquinone biosynthesis C-methylase UbiE
MSDKSYNIRLEHEIEHGKKLTSEGAEAIWNWSSPAGKIRAERRARYFVSVGKITLTDKVLEIGCGTGLFTKKVKELTRANIIATDLSPDLLDIAKNEVHGVNFLLADAMHLPFVDNEFDVVFGSSILHHLDFIPALTEILRVLKPGGRMVFAEPNMLNPQIFVQKNIPFIKKWLGDSPDETAIIRWKFARLMKRIGFIDISIFTYDFLHPSTPNIFLSLVNKIGKLVEKIPLLREISGSVIIFGRKP